MESDACSAFLKHVGSFIDGNVRLECAARIVNAVFVAHFIDDINAVICNVQFPVRFKFENVYNIIMCAVIVTVSIVRPVC